ncbi:MAG: FkbM family methyltransferase [Caulobacteraceae bacterium]
MKVDEYASKVEGFSPRVIVHVGASYLQEIDRYQRMIPCKIVWIEAVPKLLADMERRVADCGDAAVEHVLIQALVTERDGDRVEFHHFSNKDASSSIFPATDRLRGRWPNVKETGDVSILTSSRLETVLQKAAIDPADVDVLLLDIQGAELIALKGAGAYLDQVTFVEVEMSLEEIYAGGVLYEDLNAWLEGRGFARVSPVKWHGDVVYVRAARLADEAFAALRNVVSA